MALLNRNTALQRSALMAAITAFCAMIALAQISPPTLRNCTATLTTSCTWTFNSSGVPVPAVPAASLPTFLQDVTNSGATMTVVGLNGTSLAGLGSGLLTNSTGTGVPTITAICANSGSVSCVGPRDSNGIQAAVQFAPANTNALAYSATVAVTSSTPRVFAGQSVVNINIDGGRGYGFEDIVNDNSSGSSNQHLVGHESLLYEPKTFPAGGTDLYGYVAAAQFSVGAWPGAAYRAEFYDSTNYPGQWGKSFWSIDGVSPIALEADGSCRQTGTNTCNSQKVKLVGVNNGAPATPAEFYSDPNGVFNLTTGINIGAGAALSGYVNLIKDATSFGSNVSAGVGGGDSFGYHAFDTSSHDIFSLTRQGNNLSITTYATFNIAVGKTAGPSTAYAMTINTSGNTTFTGTVAASSGANVVYRCLTAGTLPIGALTINSGACGTSSATGFLAN